MKIVVFGASGGTGVKIVEQALAAGCAVTEWNMAERSFPAPSPGSNSIHWMMESNRTHNATWPLDQV
jgi:hypothetical protein